MSPEASCHQSNDDSSIVGYLHEPWMCRADIPVCRFGRLSIRPKQKHGTGMSREPAGWKACATDWRGFMVPMHAKKRKGAFHDSQGVIAGCANQFSFTPRGNRL